MVYVYLCIGLVLLLVGGDLLVRGAVSVAKKLGVSTLMIGLTLVGFGTSTPELVTSIRAALLGSAGISIGNVVGSNIANILLVLGVAAAISSVNLERTKYFRDSLMLVITLVLFSGTALLGYINLPIGIVFFIVLLSYIIYTYYSEKKLHKEIKTDDKFIPKKPMIIYLLITAVGIALTVLGADILVRSAIDIARKLQINETVIGLTVVAVGTSLPELAATVMAAIRKENGVALGNIIGSNIFNILFILGTTGVIQTINIPPEIMRVDLWVMVAATLLLIFFTALGKVMGRATGISFILLYGVYIYYLSTVSAA